MSGPLGIREPPEGAIVGESVPVENDRDRLDEGRVAELAGVLKAHPAYHGRSDSELREIAREKLEE